MKKSTSRSQRVERTDLYQQVTDRIVAALEKGVPPWRKPWRSVEKYASSPFPVNAATGVTTTALISCCCGWQRKRRATVPIAGSPISRRRQSVGRFVKVKAA